jgi:putative ABC transport system ATP-binding protein
VIILEKILKVEKIQKYYGNKDNITKALDQISFDVDEGEFIGIMGASGSGKTTLLNCISTIDNVSSGHIYLGNQDITEIKEADIAKFRRENLGFIFQDFNLLDTLTMEENIALILTINKIPEKEIDTKIKDIAKKLGIENILNKYPYQVSGGQKQRTAACRAIVNSPKIILADEPTGSLDSKSAKQLLEIMEDMNKNMKATILMVTHDTFTASYCSKILFLKDGKIFNKIEKGEKQRKDFYNEILDVLALLGGDARDVR